MKQDIKGSERLRTEWKGKNEGVVGLEVWLCWLCCWWWGVLTDYPVHLAQLCRPTHSHQSGTPYLPEA